MISYCPNCERKTHMIDASIYAGDYHGGHLWAPGRQCVSCGIKWAVHQVGKSVRLRQVGAGMIPPRNRWEEPQHG